MKQTSPATPTNQERIRHLALLCHADRLELRLLAAPTPRANQRPTVFRILTNSFGVDTLLGLLPLLPQRWGRWIGYGAAAYRAFRQSSER